MVSYVLNVDKVGDLKLGSKKCRLHKKDEVVKVAKDYGIPSANKKTVKELCGALKTKIMKAGRVSNQIKKDLNNVPLAKLYPGAAKKQMIDKKRVEKKALDKKAVTNFMKAMTTKIPRPTKKAMPLTKEEGIKRIRAMKGLSKNAKMRLVNRLNAGTMSPRRVVKVARELSRLNVAAYRI